jgi:hypothetical protein
MSAALLLAGALTLSGDPCFLIEVHVPNCFVPTACRRHSNRARTYTATPSVRVDAQGAHTVEPSHAGFQTLCQVEAQADRAVRVERGTVQVATRIDGGLLFSHALTEGPSPKFPFRRTSPTGIGRLPANVRLPRCV